MQTIQKPLSPSFTGRDLTIMCDRCGHSIPITKAIEHKVAETLRLAHTQELQQNLTRFEDEKRAIKMDYEQKIELAKKEIRDQALADAQSTRDGRVATLEKSLADHRERLQAAEDRELAVLQREKELEEQIRSLPLEIERRMSEERARIRTFAEAELRETWTREQELQHESLEQQRIAFETREIEALRRERELASRVERLDQEVLLGVERVLAEQETNIRQSAVAELQEEFLARLREKEEQIAQMNRTIADLQRRGLQVSQQVQGEAQEIALEQMLAVRFPLDTFAAVSAGTRGADVLQTVILPTGLECGTILYESKRTKEFNRSWIDKVKQDRADANAEVAVIVTAATPKDSSRISIVDGVIVCDFPSVVEMVSVVRMLLIRISQTTVALLGRSEKADRVYHYLLGPGFQHLVSIIDETVTVQQEVEKEKRNFDRLVRKRIQQLEKILVNANSLYGDLQGITSDQLPDIEEPAADTEPSGDGPVEPSADQQDEATEDESVEQRNSSEFYSSESFDGEK